MYKKAGIRLNHMESANYIRLLADGLSSGKLLPRDSSAEIAAQLKVQAVGRGANVILMTPDTDNNDAGGVFYKTRHLTNGLTGVNPIQLYLDFSLYAGRGEEQADFLVEHSLGFRT